MARDFDGTNDNISFGSDASIDGYAQKTIACWVRVDIAEDVFRFIGAKLTGSVGWHFSANTFSDPDAYVFTHEWTGGPGTWIATVLTTGELHHICWTYDSSSAANDPVFYFDGLSTSITETDAPSGTPTSDAGNNLRLGESDDGTIDFDGVVGNFAYDNVIWSADDVRRHMRWGIPRGGTSCQVWHPLDTTSLTNKGSATANGTASGTTMVAASKSDRRFAQAMLGIGG